jgi:phage terminase large subunit-like protein
VAPPEIQAAGSPRQRKPKKAAPRDHVAIARKFEEDVLSGAFPCGVLFRAAVERQRADLARTDIAYRFDADLGAKAVRFLELLPHVDGPKAGELFEAQPWQVWAVSVLHGWVSKVNGYPRFRRATLFMAKGNGKTFLAAGIALYPLCTGGTGDKVFSAATTREQAGLSFQTARHMLLKSPRLVERFGLEVGQHAIIQPASGAAYRCFSSEARSAEGVIPRLIVEDEIHAHPDRELHDNLRSSAAKRPDSQMVVISTAGFDMSPGAIGYEVYGYAKDILEGRLKDDSQFALLIEADEKDDPWDPATWRKANPNLGVSIDAVEVENEANEARQRPGKQPSFFTKRLGRWVKSAARWIPPASWDACADATLKREDFTGPAYIGVDLASTRDLTAKVLVFVSMREDGQREYSVFCDTYLPSESVTFETVSEDLRLWASEGWLTLTPGPALNLGIVQGEIAADLERMPGSEVCYDPWGAAALVQLLEPAGATCVEIRQGAKTQSEPMKALEAAILDKRLRHDGNPVLSWCIGNVLARADRNGNIAPDRENEGKKIDCAVALINAFVRAHIADVSGAGSVYAWSA